MPTPRKIDRASALAELYFEKGPTWRSRTAVIHLRAPSDDEAADSRIPVTLSSETPVERYDWWNDEVYTEILDHTAVDLQYCTDGLPFCVDHDTERMVGLVEDIKVVDSELVGMVRFGDHPDSGWVEADIRSGIRKKVSIAYLQGEFTEEKRKSTEPAVRRYAFAPLEGSSVPIPADYEVGFSGQRALRALRSRDTTIPGQTATRAKEKTMKSKLVSDPAGAGDDQGEQEQRDAVAENAAAEKLRVKKLRGLVDQYDADPSFVLDAIESGMTVRQAMDKLAEQKDEESEGSDARKIRTGSAPDHFTRSKKGPIGRDGKVKEDDETGGFDDAGEYMQAVARAAMGGDGAADKRLKVERGASGQSEGSASGGGFMVPKAVQVEMIEDIWNTGQILSRVHKIPITSNGIKVVRPDETSRADGSRGGAVVAYWANEAQAIAGPGMIKMREHNLDTDKLFALGYATEELVEDAPALVAELAPQFQSEITFKAEDAVFEGNGNGQPLGLMNGGCVVQVAIEGTQTIANTNTFVATNVAKMKARMNPVWYSRSVWLMNPDLEPMLITATLGGTAIPVYMPPGGLSASPYGTILGRPVIFTEYNNAVGTPGDIVLADLQSYDLAERGGIKSTSSSEVKFLTDEMTFKWTYRIAGQPARRSPIAPFKGTNSRAPFITVGVRA